MKKITLITMALIMAVGFSFAMTGCGSDNTEETTEPATEATTTVANDYADIAGNYQDEVSQRATMNIEIDDDEPGVEIEIIWSTSATETIEWSMDAVLDGDKLTYATSEKEVTTTDANGAEIGEQESQPGGGYFLIGEDGSLLWEGAPEDTCKECKFVKMQ